MKKTMMIAALFAASALAASAADVYSSNIVGYSKIDLVPGYTMVGAPFQAVGSTGTINVQDVVDTTGLVGFDWDLGMGGDQLIIWDPLSQMYAEIYVWSDADPLSTGAMNKWIDEGTLSPVVKDLPVGSTFFVLSSSPTNFVGSLIGEVPAAAAGQDIAFANGFTMVANPFPYALDINADMIPTGLVGFDWDLGMGGDQLIIWDTTAQMYSQIYVWSNADPLSTGALNKWIDEGTLAPVNVQIPIGGAFFINSTGAGGTIDFAAP